MLEDRKTRDYLAAIYSWCVEYGESVCNLFPTAVRAMLLILRGRCGGVDTKVKPFGIGEEPDPADYPKTEYGYEDYCSDRNDHYRDMEKRRGHLERLFQCLHPYRQLADATGGRPPKTTVSRWLKDADRLEVEFDADGRPRGRAVYVATLAAAVACEKDGTGYEGMFGCPETGSSYWDFCWMLMVCIGSPTRDLRSVLERASRRVTDEDRLRRLLKDTLEHLDLHAMESLRPLMADYLEHHATWRGVHGDDFHTFPVFDDDTGREFDVDEGPAVDVRNNIENLKARHETWPMVSPSGVPVWTDPARFLKDRG